MACGDTFLVGVEAQSRGAGVLELRLRIGIKPVCGTTVCSVACSE